MKAPIIATTGTATIKTKNGTEVKMYKIIPEMDKTIPIFWRASSNYFCMGFFCSRASLINLYYAIVKFLNAS